ncbi:MAG: HlyD family type I secretion periplasmic adaptor subunit [Beijerinckiaceae bacterium]|nr:HlyD family type I secretion periplasmic adaptor subunit [Beijerinckiaceae bacterium]
MNAAPPLSPREQAQQALPPRPAMARHIGIGAATIGLGFCGFVFWLVVAQLSGAVLAPAMVVVDGEVKKIQHLAGGIVGAIPVTNGQRVGAGDILVRLDDTIPRTNLAQIVSQLVQQTGRRARLEAERDDRPDLALPAGFRDMAPDAAAVAEGEQRLLSENRALRDRQADQLRERAGQYQREIEGLEAQLAGKKEEARLIAVELKGVLELFEKNLIPINRVSALQREAARLQGETGSLMAAMAKARGQIAEINLQLLSLDNRMRTDAVKELREVEGAIAQLVERRAAAEDVLARIEIRAPHSGFVHELAVHTIGGVIAPGQTVLAIVPDNDRLAVELRLSPIDIDQIRLGQRVMLRFSAFNQRTTPELPGRITRVAADATREPQTGMTYFVARAELEPGSLARLGSLALTPGMPVEAFVETGERTALSYFAKPLTDAFHRAFREE